MKIRVLFLASLVLIYYSLSNCCIQTEAKSSGKTLPIPFLVGVILDIESQVGRMCSSCISMAVEDFYSVLHNRDSKDLVSAFFTDLSKDANMIIAPRKPSHARVVGELGIRAKVPVISFSTINPFITRGQMPYFIEIAKNETYQFKAITSIIFAYEWKEVILIYEETDYGSRTKSYLIDELQNAKEIGVMSKGTAWTITEEMTSYLSFMIDIVINSMSCVLYMHPFVPRTEEIENYEAGMNNEIDDGSGTVHDILISCLHDYDLILAIAAAAERVGTHPSFQEPKQHKKFIEMLDLADTEFGLELLKEILDSKLKGQSREIRHLDGQLRSVIYTKRDIGFWNSTIGHANQFNGTSQSYLSRTIWPREAVTVPKGWRIPPNSKKLRIGFLLKNAFHEMVNISSNRTSVTCYCIDVFKTVMEALPYNAPYALVPFEYEYDDMIQQVYLETLDAAVGYAETRVNHSFYREFSYANTYEAASLNCTSHQVLLINISAVSLFSFVLHLLLCIFRNSIDNWKRLKGIFHIAHGECSEARELDGHNIIVSIDPGVFVKDSKQ